MLDVGKDKYLQVVSCNTHNLSVLIKTFGLGDEGPDNLVEGRFVCMRRSNDISQDDKFVPSPQVGSHKDARFGTHHARDAWHLFQTKGQEYDLNLFSSAMKVNSQLMHVIHFHLKVRQAGRRGTSCSSAPSPTTASPSPTRPPPTACSRSAATTASAGAS